MSQTIWKFPLQGCAYIFGAPQGAKARAVGWHQEGRRGVWHQEGRRGVDGRDAGPGLVLWLEVDPSAPTVFRRAYTVWTGEPFTHPPHAEYVGTATSDDDLVYHVYLDPYEYSDARATVRRA